MIFNLRLIENCFGEACSCGFTACGDVVFGLELHNLRFWFFVNLFPLCFQKNHVPFNNFLCYIKAVREL